MGLGVQGLLMVVVVVGGGGSRTEGTGFRIWGQGLRA